MRTISVAIPETDYEAFRHAAESRHRSMAQLIREAMALYGRKRLEERTPLTDLPLLTGHRPIAALPTRAEIYDELFSHHGGADS